MKPEKLNLTLELDLSVPLSRKIVKDPYIHKQVVKRLQGALDEMGEEDRHLHNEITRLKKTQDDFLRGTLV